MNFTKPQYLVEIKNLAKEETAYVRTVYLVLFEKRFLIEELDCSGISKSKTIELKDNRIDLKIYFLFHLKKPTFIYYNSLKHVG